MADASNKEWFPFFLRVQVRDEEHFQDIKQQFVHDFAHATHLPPPDADGDHCLQLVRISPNTLLSPFREIESGKTFVEMMVRPKFDSLVHENAKGQRQEPKTPYRSALHFVQECSRLVSEPYEGKSGLGAKNPIREGKLTGLIDDVSCPELEGGQDRATLLEADIICKIGDVLSDLGSHEQAESKYVAALHRQRAIYDSDEASIATTLLKIGEARRNQLKLDKALEVAEECRAMRSRLLGYEDCSLAEAYELHGSICDNKGRYREALKSFSTAKRIYLTRRGPASLEVARTAIRVGSAQDQLWKLASAKAEFSAALDVYTACNDSVGAARCLNNLAVIHRKQGDPKRALELLDKAKTLVCDKMGQDNLDFIGLVRSTGAVHFEMQAWKEAQEQWELATEMIAAGGPQRVGESVDAALTMLNIGSVHLRMSRYRDAHEMYGRVYAQLVKLLGKEHVDTARALVGLGTSSEKLGDLEKARERLQTALTIMRRVLGRAHVEVADVELNLATVLLRQATATTVVQDGLHQWQPEPQDSSFPMSAAAKVQLTGNQVEKLQDNSDLQNDLCLHIARSVADMDRLGGVGAELMTNVSGQIVVAGILKGGPADLAGLLKGETK